MEEVDKARGMGEGRRGTWQGMAAGSIKEWKLGASKLFGEIFKEGGGSILGLPLPGTWGCLWSWRQGALPLVKWIWGLQEYPISPSKAGELKKEQYWHQT